MYLKKIEKSIKFEHFNNEFLLLFLPLDPDPETRLNPDPIRIRIRNTGEKEENGLDIKLPLGDKNLAKINWTF